MATQNKNLAAPKTSTKITAETVQAVLAGLSVEELQKIAGQKRLESVGPLIDAYNTTADKLAEIKGKIQERGQTVDWSRQIRLGKAVWVVFDGCLSLTWGGYVGGAGWVSSLCSASSSSSSSGAQTR
jgi:hypothetical protein